MSTFSEKSSNERFKICITTCRFSFDKPKSVFPQGYHYEKSMYLKITRFFYNMHNQNIKIGCACLKNYLVYHFDLKIAINIITEHKLSRPY